MRNVSIQELEADAAGLISEVEAGQRLTLIRGGKAVAEIVPHSDALAADQTRAADFQEMVAGGEPTTYEQRQRTAEEGMTHDQAVEQLMTTLEKGFDLGGFKITNRDELYERD